MFGLGLYCLKFYLSGFGNLFVFDFCLGFGVWLCLLFVMYLANIWFWFGFYCLCFVTGFVFYWYFVVCLTCPLVLFVCYCKFVCDFGLLGCLGWCLALTCICLDCYWLVYYLIFMNELLSCCLDSVGLGFVILCYFVDFGLFDWLICLCC